MSHAYALKRGRGQRYGTEVQGAWRGKCRTSFEDQKQTKFPFKKIKGKTTERRKMRRKINSLSKDVPEQAGRTAPPQKRTSQRHEIMMYMFSRKVTGVANRHPKKAEKLYKSR